MKMKNEKNKMLMALAVVAALAAVSFAGIALSDDAAAAEGTIRPLGIADNDTIIRESNINSQYYFDDAVMIGSVEANVAFLIIPSDATVSGTISIGTRDDNGTPGDPEDDIFTAIDTIKLTNASGVRMTLFAYMDASGELVTYIAIGNIDTKGDVLPSGTFELTEGKVILGQTSPGLAALIRTGTVTPANVVGLITPFNGTIKAGEFEMTSEYVVGTIIGLDDSGAAYLSGAIVTYNEVLPQDSPGVVKDGIKATASLKGTAVVDNPANFTTAFTQSYYDLLNNGPYVMIAEQTLLIDSVTVTIEDGAEIVVGGVEPKSAGAISLDLDASVTVAGAVLIDGNKAYSGTFAPGAITFSNVPIGPSYQIIIYTGVGAVDHFFYGEATIIGSGTNCELVITTSSSLATDIVDETDSTQFTKSTATQFLIGNLHDLRAFVVIDTMNNATVGVLGDAVGTDNEIDVTGTISASDIVLAVIRQVGSPGTSLGYVATVGATTAVEANEVPLAGTDLVIVTTTPASAEEVKVGTITTSISRGALIVQDEGITVKGTLKFIYESTAINGRMVNQILVSSTNETDIGVVLEGNGMIEYGVIPQTAPPAPITNKVTAAYYFVNEGTSPVKNSTYYYTTIENALKNSANITLVGKHVILVDKTLESTFNAVTITIAPNGWLIVGQKDDVTTTDVDEYAAPTFTVPQKFKIVNQNTVPADFGFRVEAGQAVFDTTNSVKPTFEPTSDTVKVSTTKIVYADLVTALKNAVADDVVELRQNATLGTSATVKDKVTLKNKGFILTIPTKTTLDVIGSYESTAQDVINGTLRVSGTASFKNGVVLGGTIDVTSTGTVTVETNPLLGGTQGILVIDGTFNAKNAVTVAELNLTGTLNITSAVFTVMKKVVIGKEPTLLTAANLDNTRAAVAGGTITLDNAAYALVWGAASVDDTDFTGAGTVKTEFFIARMGNMLFATQYANSATTAVLEYLFADKLLDYDLQGWYKNPQLLGTILAYPVPSTELVGVTPAYYGDFTPKEYTLKLNFNSGVEWLFNGIGQGKSRDITVVYGQEVRVSVDVLSGYTGTPVITKDGSAYSNNSKFTVTGNVEFNVSGISVAVEKDTSGDLTLIEILLIIIVIIIAIISVIVALRLLRS